LGSSDRPSQMEETRSYPKQEPTINFNSAFLRQLQKYPKRNQTAEHTRINTQKIQNYFFQKLHIPLQPHI